MLKTFTFWLTLLAALLCLYHMAALDHDDVVFLMFSPVTWILPFFQPLNRYDPMFVYACTVLVWFAAGFFLDRYFQQYNAKEGAR